MKTLKWVRRAIILDGTYCLFAMIAFIGMKIDHGILGVIGVAIIHVLPSESMWTSDVDLWDDRLFPRFTP